MNLLPAHFDQSFLKPVLAGWESCEFKGEKAPGILVFDLRRNEIQKTLLFSSVIRKEEDLIWKSCHELLATTLKNAASVLQGFFGFDLLTVELGDRMQSFQWEIFRQFIVNQARAMAVGEVRLIQYTSVFGLLKKRVAETYGKMDYHAFVKIYSQEPSKLDLQIKKMMKEGNSQPAIGVLQDLSREPLFRFGDEEQTPRLRKLLENWQASGPLPEFYILDNRGQFELGAQFGMRSHV